MDFGFDFISEYFTSESFLRGAYFLTFILVLLVMFEIVLRGFLKRLEVIAKQTETDLDDFVVNILQHLRWPVFIVLVLISGYAFMDFGAVVKKGVSYAIFIFIIYGIIRVAELFIDYLSRKFIEKKFKGANVPQMGIVVLIMKITVWSLGILMVLSNLGYNVNSLIAGLGIGGIAVALAIQNILGDLFSSVSIYMDKPFKVGDLIFVNDQYGKVKKIGIKTTRITTLQGEELVIPNQKLVSTAIQNYGKLKRRRVTFKLALAYDTPLAKIKKLPPKIKKIIDDIDGITADRVSFKTFGETSLDFEVVYYVESNDYSVCMERQQDVNFQVIEALEKMGIQRHVPEHSVRLKK